VARQHGTPNWGSKRGVLNRRMSFAVMCSRPEGNGDSGGVRGDGQWLAVREGGTQQRGARGSDGDLRGGPGAALHGGSTVAEQGGTVGATGGRKKGCSRGVGHPL
jgi:hypothetical protein